MQTLLSIILIFLVIHTLQILAALLEKRFISPCKETVAFEPDARFGYLTITVVEMKNGGFNVVFKAHKKYPIKIVFGLSPDKSVLVQAGEGTMIGAKVKQMWLYTRLEDGHILITSDLYDEGDHSGITEIKRVVNGDFLELYRIHMDRLQKDHRRVDRFIQEDPYRGYEEINQLRMELLVEQGRARWISLDRTEWKYTLKGAILICLSIYPQYFVAICQFFRRYKKRPGE